MGIFIEKNIPFAADHMDLKRELLKFAVRSTGNFDTRKVINKVAPETWTKQDTIKVLNTLRSDAEINSRYKLAVLKAVIDRDEEIWYALKWGCRPITVHQEFVRMLGNDVPKLRPVFKRKIAIKDFSPKHQDEVIANTLKVIDKSLRGIVYRKLRFLVEAYRLEMEDLARELMASAIISVRSYYPFLPLDEYPRVAYQTAYNRAMNIIDYMNNSQRSVHGELVGLEGKLVSRVFSIEGMLANQAYSDTSALFSTPAHEVNQFTYVYNKCENDIQRGLLKLLVIDVPSVVLAELNKAALKKVKGWETSINPIDLMSVLGRDTYLQIAQKALGLEEQTFWRHVDSISAILGG